MDAYGHINNVQYIRYLEEARVQPLIRLGAALEGAAQAPVIINVGYTSPPRCRLRGAFP
jgi:acyl-CoA thioester hydrolase